MLDEIFFNVLESMLTLFTRIRTLSFARDIREKHRITKIVFENGNKEIKHQYGHGSLATILYKHLKTGTFYSHTS